MSNNKNYKFIVGDRVRIFKYSFFDKDYTKNWSREMFVIDFLLNINQWMDITKNSNEEKIIGNFYKKELSLGKL